MNWPFIYLAYGSFPRKPIGREFTELDEIGGVRSRYLGL